MSRRDGPVSERLGNSHRRAVLVKLLLILVPVLGLVLIAYRIYGVDTQHANRGSIWFSEECRNLIPPTATRITLRRDLLDHYAAYTIVEKDLNTFLDQRFSRPGAPLDSYSERTPVNPEHVGTTVGPFGWVVTRETVRYTCFAANGGAHAFYHDPATGLTYQSSAYW